MERITVALDGSEHSEKARDHASEIAARCGADGLGDAQGLLLGRSPIWPSAPACRSSSSALTGQ